MQLCFKEHFMAKENKHDMLIKKNQKKNSILLCLQFV